MINASDDSFIRVPPQPLLVALVCFCLAGSAPAATLTVTTNSLGGTPEILAYNSGHFYTNSNTRDWWRYSGVSGARVFASAGDIEATDDIAGWGDGVTDQTSFVARKTALRANPLSATYINWSYFTNRYETLDLGSASGNHLKINYCFREMRRLGIRICAQITGSESSLPITSTSDWAGKWEFWQHYYAQSFYMARVFDVDHYQMYNEPDAVATLTSDAWLMRLQLASDAIQSAIADVNTLYGKSLVPKILAPVNAGNAYSDYGGGLLGGVAVTNRHVNYLGVTDPNWLNLQKYDFHEYDHSPSTHAANLVTLNSLLTSGMSPESRFPTTITEFNTHTGANFDALTNTLDAPSEYATFGGICVALMSNQCSELYTFKFSQTDRTGGTYPVAKNAMHYVDNANSPYNIGGITRAGEAYRLFNKAFAPGRDRLNSVKGSGATSFEAHASYDSIRKRYYLYSVNNTASDVAIDFAFTTLPVPVGNRVLLEEVSEATYGGGKLWTNVPAGKTISAGIQAANSVWLLTIPAESQAAEQILTNNADAEVRDGSNKGVNYGSATSMTARNDPASTANRSAAFMKFDLTGIVVTNIEFAILSLQASTVTTNATAQAHVYALDTNNWSPNTITWSNAPNLKQNVTVGNTIAKQFVTNAGGSAHIVGQVVVNSTNATEKLIDVTDWMRTQTNTAITFLVSQDPRWDVALPSLATGDTQPDGVKIIATEGGNGPRLRLILKTGTPNTPPVAVNDAAATLQNKPVLINVLANDSDSDGGTLSIVSFTQAVSGSVSNSGNGTLTYSPNLNFSGSDSFSYTITDGQGGTNSASVSVTVNGDGTTPYWTNLLVTTEAFIRGGASANADQDEVATGYIMVKYNASPFDTSRKAYFQFDLTGLNVDGSMPAVLTVSFLNNFKQNIQLWALNQAYTNFASTVTWNTAPANDTNSNNLLTGVLNATAIGAVTNIPASGTSPVSLAVPLVGNYIRSNHVTLVLSGSPDAGSFTNDSGGLRMLRTTATLQVLVIPPPVASFTGTPTNGLAPLTVTFTNLSTGAANYSWDFGDGKTSAGSNPVNTYTNAGSYRVTLSATGPGGSNFLGRANYITVTNLPVGVNFTGTPTNGLAPLTVTFTNLSTGATNYTWNFGDGKTSAGSNPVNTYTNAGSYLVTLSATGPGGGNFLARTNYITVANPSYLPPIITRGVLNSNGSVTLSFLGATNRTHWIQTRTNLALGNWTNINTNVSDANGGWSFTDFNATNQTQDFYRAVLP